MKIVLISTYELGRQPFCLVSPAAWLRAAGHEVVCLDLTRQELDEWSLLLKQRCLAASYQNNRHTTRWLDVHLVACIADTDNDLLEQPK